MDSKYYLDFIDEGSYKRAYNISLTHTHNNIDKKSKSKKYKKNI